MSTGTVPARLADVADPQIWIRFFIFDADPVPDPNSTFYFDADTDNAPH
jgi:hypothetical protein